MRKQSKPKKTNAYWRKKAVAEAKRVAKERDEYQCQRCPKNKSQGWQIHGSHVFSEGKHHSLSADPDNIKALCAQCHMWWHENPIQSSKWFKETFPERYKKLWKLSLTSRQLDFKKVYEELKKI